MTKDWDISANENLFLYDELYDIKPTNHELDPQSDQTSPLTAVLLIVEIETTERVQFLSKVMQSVGVNLKDCKTIFGATTTPKNMPTSNIVLSFGTNKGNQTNYERKIMDEITFWQFDELDQIQNDTSKKRKLWECLKIAFPESQN